MVSHCLCQIPVLVGFFRFLPSSLLSFVPSSTSERDGEKKERKEEKRWRRRKEGKGSEWGGRRRKKGGTIFYLPSKKERRRRGEGSKGEKDGGTAFYSPEKRRREKEGRKYCQLMLPKGREKRCLVRSRKEERNLFLHFQMGAGEGVPFGSRGGKGRGRGKKCEVARTEEEAFVIGRSLDGNGQSEHSAPFPKRLKKGRKGDSKDNKHFRRSGRSKGRGGGFRHLSLAVSVSITPILFLFS